MGRLDDPEVVRREYSRVVAVTNSGEHLRELAELLAVEREESVFSAENGETQLRGRSAEIERPEFDGPLRMRRTPVVFVAETPR